MTTIEIGTLRISRAAMGGGGVGEVEDAVRRALVDRLSGVPANGARQALEQGRLRIGAARAPVGDAQPGGEA